MPDVVLPGIYESCLTRPTDALANMQRMRKICHLPLLYITAKTDNWLNYLTCHNPDMLSLF